MSYLRVLADHPRFLAFGFGLTLLSSFGQTFFVSVFGGAFREAFALTDGQYGLTYSLATLASGLTIAKVGELVDSRPLRPLVAVIAAGLTLAAVLIASAPHVVVLGLGFFLVRLNGQGLLSHVSMTAMSRYFDADRGKALSVAGLGFPAGEAVLPLLGALALAHVGWRGSWAGVALLVPVAGLVLAGPLLRGHAARHARWLESMEAEAAAEAAEARDAGAERPAGAVPRRRQWTRREVLRDPRFALLLLAVAAPGFIATGLFFHQVRLVEEKGWTLTWFAASFAVFAAVQLPAGLLAGPLVDRFGGRRLLPLVLLPLSASCLVLAASDARWVPAAFMALLGLTSGTASPVVGSAWAELYGVRHLGAIRGTVTAVLVVGTAGSPVAMGLLIDAGVRLDVMSLACAGYAAAAAGLAGLVLRRRD